jgi:hypothetical protein
MKNVKMYVEGSMVMVAMAVLVASLQIYGHATRTNLTFQKRFYVTSLSHISPNFVYLLYVYIYCLSFYVYILGQDLI